MGVETSALWAAEPSGRPQRFWNGIAWTEVGSTGVPGIVTQRPPSEPVTGDFPRPSAGAPARTAAGPGSRASFGTAPHPTRGPDRLPCHRARRDGRRRAAAVLAVLLAVLLAVTLGLGVALLVAPAVLP